MTLMVKVKLEGNTNIDMIKIVTQHRSQNRGDLHRILNTAQNLNQKELKANTKKKNISIIIDQTIQMRKG